MTRLINIVTEKIQMKAELNNSKTADLLWDSLPLEGRVNTWGEEIYFRIPLETGPENAVSVVEEGDLAYWPEGSCFCIFFGKTPASAYGEIKPASPVSLVGRLCGDPKAWLDVKDGEDIALEKAGP